VHPCIHFPEEAAMTLRRRTVKPSHGTGGLDRAKVRRVLLSLGSATSTEKVSAQTRRSLADRLAVRANLPAATAQRTLKVLFSSTGIIPQTLLEGECVRISGFGTFQVDAGQAGGGRSKDAQPCRVDFRPDKRLIGLVETE
jgi:nucleoid DNA-binding protein